MNKFLLRKISSLSIIDGKINTSIIDLVLKKLSKSDLKTYLFYLKQEIKNSTIYVSSPQTLSPSEKKKIINIFGEKRYNFIVDKKITAGVIIKNGDDSIDTTINGTITQIIGQLKNTL